jgi:hypothetical protein
MNYIKSHIILLAASTIAIIIFTVLLCVSMYLSNTNTVTISNTKRENNTIKQKANRILPFVALDHDLYHAQKDLDSIAQIERSQNRHWSTVLSKENNLAINWKNKESESINSTLIRQFTQLRKLCGEKRIILPGSSANNPSSPFLAPTNTSRVDFGFGFKSYDGNWPNFSTEEAQKLGIQMAIIKQIFEYLAKSSSDDRSMRLISILREPVGPIDDRYIGDDKLELDSYGTKLLKPQLIIDSMCIQVTFIGITSHARTFMNQLTPPYLLRDFVVTRDTSNSLSSQLDNQNNFTQDFSTTDSSELPIVQDVRSKYSFLIEYVVNVNRDHDKFYKHIIDHESVDIEIMTDFLEKAGHSKMIEPLIQYFKDRDDS